MHYEHEDKPSKLLAHQLRQESASHQIPQIQTTTGITTDPKLINKQFKQFYSSLYTSEHPHDPDASDCFLMLLILMWLDTLVKIQIFLFLFLEKKGA